MCEDSLIPIFVYGTLIPHRSELSKVSPIKDTISGVDLYDLGHFPAILPGSGEVEGYILYVNRATLVWLDAYETDMYSRKPFITIGGRPVQAYVFNMEIPSSAKVSSWPV